MNSNAEAAAHEVKPTARAISERIFKLRRVNASSTSSDSANGKVFAPVLPRKRKTMEDSPNGVLPTTENGMPKKRGRGRPPKKQPIATFSPSPAGDDKLKAKIATNGHNHDEDGGSELDNGADYIIDGFKEEMSDDFY